MKTPEEIKKGLECCCTDENGKIGRHDGCPYIMELGDCLPMLLEDALALIRQLEAERDAAVHDLNKLACKSKCLVCKAYDGFEHCVAAICSDCYNGSKFEWRGLCEENGGKEK